MVNSLERPVFEKYRLLPALKQWLLECPEVDAALMSGSGSTMFALTKSVEASQSLIPKARAFCGDTAWFCATEINGLPTATPAQ
jgi:4-diphosphocytidyl-2-C-methyl-D-erythritol kinase